MTTTASTSTASRDATRGTPATDPTERFRRLGTATGLVVGPLGFLAANTTYAWTTRHGGDDLTAQHAISLYGAHPTATRVAITAVMVGALFIVPGLLGAMRVLRTSSPKLSLFAGVTMIAGYICYFGVVAATFQELAMVEHGLTGPAAAKAIDAGQSDVWSVWIFLLFVLGNLVGTLVLGIAMIRSHVVPLWAALGVMAWPVLHVTGLVAGTEWFEVAGAAFQVVGFAVLARVVARSVA